METASCAKCGGEMDQGFMTTSRAATGLAYVPGDQRAHFFFKTVNLNRARACLVCGFVELYVDPEELRRKRQG